MHKPEQIGDMRDNWKRCTTLDKTLAINDFLYECGEDATWEDWLDFLQKQHKFKCFEWTLSVE